jgi:hypothetical protein
MTSDPKIDKTKPAIRKELPVRSRRYIAGVQGDLEVAIGGEGREEKSQILNEGW